MAAPIHDDGFHEIQLNGKQLVFLFMAATVLSVVIFLCGVLVGRGVRAERASSGEAAALNEPPGADRAPETTAGSIISPGQDPTVAPPPVPTPDDLSYPDRLAKPATTEAGLSKAARPPAAAAVEKPVPAPAPPREVPDIAAAPEAGFAVQVAALNVRSEADAIARRLTAKGYAAYVQAPTTNSTPPVYRVRVGTFKTKREADTVAARLKKEEKITPWVTR